MKRIACYCLFCAALPLAAQTTTDQGASAGNPGTMPTQSTRTDDRDRHDYGWLGLAGLAGLAGLMRRQRTDDARNIGTRPTDRV